MLVHAGHATADITPTGTVELNGFASRKQPATGVAAPVHARVVVLRRGRARVVLAVCDLLGFSVPDSRWIEERIATAAGCSPANVLLACTHTHSAPISMPLGLVGRYDRNYVGTIADILTAVTAAAVNDLAPVRGTVFGSCSVADLGAFRCATSEPGRDHWPGRMETLKLDRDDAPAVLLIYVGIHPYVLGSQNRRLHPDYPGPACVALEQKYHCKPLILPGCGADIMPTPGMTRSFGKVEKFGRTIARRAVDSVSPGHRFEVDGLRACRRSPRIRFGFLPPDSTNADEPAIRALFKAGRKFLDNHGQWRVDLVDGRMPTSTTFPLHTIELGGLVVVGMSAELFYDTGMDIRAALPNRPVWVVSQAGGDIGYLPRPFAYEHRTYECSSAHQWYRTPGAALPGEEERLRAVAVSTVYSQP